MTALDLAVRAPVRAALGGLVLAGSLIGLGWLIDPDRHQPKGTP